MSRLPMLSTPGTSATLPGSGLPTPSIRRPRSSLGPGAHSTTPGSQSNGPDAAEMDSALKDILGRPHRPLAASLSNRDDPVTPTARPPSSYLAPGSERSLQAPRTPAFRPRTPSSIGTPSLTPTSRPGSRPSLASRQSLAASINTPRRQSVASSTSTPYRPESRAGAQEKWVPVVGDRVRLPSHGYEGTLRYLGTTHIRDGIWAGVELEGAFKGRGRNDGTVDGQEYFKCAPNCGIFALAEKLAPPTTAAGPSRPASVASHRSLTSSHSASGRQTPAAERARRAGATTPSFGSRSVARASAAAAKEENDATQTPTDAGRRTLLPNSTVTNAARAEARITAGSRASKYLGMTAKQLEERSTTPVTKNTLASSTTTPRVSKVGAATPNRARPSMGLATPKARGPRMSMATEMMPPPPSPQTSKVAPSVAAANTAAAAAANVALEEEIQKLRRRNTELEDQVAAANPGGDTARIEDLQRELDRVQHESDELRKQLSTSNGNETDVRARVTELQDGGRKLQTELDDKIAELSELHKEMELAAERAQGELEAGMDAKREEVFKVQERAEAAESEATELKKLVDELTLAGNQIIELNETKQFSFECTIRELEDKLTKATEDLEAKASTPAPDGEATQRAVTAAEIDNETLNAQVKHLQNRILGLEEQLEEARGQAESDSDAWQGKYNKSRDNEKALVEQLEKAKAEIAALKGDTEDHTARETDLKGALAENQAALETARAEIETFRAEASEAAAARSARDKTSSASETEIAELQSRLVAANTRCAELDEHVGELETEVATLRTKAVENSPGSRSRQSLMSNGSMDDPKILGYHHIVNDMKAENSNLKEEITSLKEEIKLLQELNDSPGGGGAAEDVAKLRAELGKQAGALKDYEREVSELESLIESKIYREDELETRLQELEHDIDRWRAKAQALAAGSAASSVHSRSTSLTSNGVASVSEETRCELCEGPHDLDACPVFAGTTLQSEGGGDGAAAAGKTKKKWCNDCESDAHATTDCPLADDMF